MTTVVAPCQHDGREHRVPGDLAVEVGVDVDEAGRDEQPVGVDLLAARRRRPRPTSVTTPSSMATSAVRRVGPGAVDDRAATDHQIVHAIVPLSGVPEGRDDHRPAARRRTPSPGTPVPDVASDPASRRRVALRDRRIGPARRDGPSAGHPAPWSDCMSLVEITSRSPGRGSSRSTDPSVLNAMSIDLVIELHDAFEACGADNDCSVVDPHRGRSGPSAPVSTSRTTGSSPTSTGCRSGQIAQRSMRYYSRLIPTMRRLPQPVIAAVNGAGLRRRHVPVARGRAPHRRGAAPSSTAPASSTASPPPSWGPATCSPA